MDLGVSVPTRWGCWGCACFLQALVFKCSLGWKAFPLVSSVSLSIQGLLRTLREYATPIPHDIAFRLVTILRYGSSGVHLHPADAVGVHTSPAGGRHLSTRQCPSAGEGGEGAKQGCIRRKGTPEAVRQAVGGGCQSG